MSLNKHNNDDVDEEVLIICDDIDNVFDLAISGVTLAAEYYLRFCLKTPCRTSLHTVWLRTNKKHNRRGDGCYVPNDGRTWGRESNDSRTIPTLWGDRWEGTAHDARIFDQALRRQNLNFPHPPAGKYYLVDSGYPTMLGYLGPYKGERYHLPDFGRNSSFRNPNEVHLVRSTMTIHNFIRRNSSTDVEFDHYANEDNMPELEEEDGQSDIHSEMQGMSSNVMELLRNRIRDDIIENSPNV
uniref:DDE Tnp4 domain-containing protein n=1 Tax=Nicotiana tabacum TaxID=4097 RepID=A0A1S4BE77_TOBAC|nr:PREDICTED: uncharacterized protein LOC107807300 [Nicotiana tabacum]